MSMPPDNPFDSRLLDLHLGHLSTTEQADLRRLIDADATLAGQNAALTTVFQALRIVPDVPAPRDLAARVMARVGAAGAVPRVVRPPDGLTAATERTAVRVIRLGNLRDIIAVAAVIVFAIGVGMPGLMYMRERQQRMACSYNLAQLGRGVQQYMGSYAGSLPFAGWNTRNSWRTTGDPAMVSMPNRAHLYPLLRQAYVLEPRLFICPAQRGVPLPKDMIPRRADFVEGRNISYVYQNMAGVRPTAQDDPRLPLLADENPLFDGGVPLFDAHRLRGDPTLANSRAHGGAGQNMLTLGGQVMWTTTPLSGLNGDNIWVLNNVLDYSGHEGPAAATDSHLLK